MEFSCEYCLAVLVQNVECCLNCITQYLNCVFSGLEVLEATVIELFIVWWKDVGIMI